MTHTDFFTLVYGDTYCRVLARTGRGLFLYGEETLEPGIVVAGKIVQPEIFARHLSTVLDTAHGGAIRSRRVVVAIPEEKVFIQIVTLPKVDRDKIDDVIRWQSEKLISFAIDSVSMDYTVIEEKGSTMEVCITASPKDVVDSIIVTLKRVGCTVIALDTHSDALARLFSVKPHMLSLLVSVEPHKATLVIAKNNIARMATVMPFDGDARVLEDKIKETMHFYLERKESDKKIGEIVLFGDIKSLIVGGAPERLGVPMRWAKFNDSIKNTHSDQLDPYIINGGLYSKHRSGINLLPSDIKQSLQKEEHGAYLVSLLRTAVFVCCVLGILGGLFWMWQKQHIVALTSTLTLQTTVPDTTDRALLEKNVTALNAQLQSMKTISLGSTPRGETIKQIVALIPESGTLTSLLYLRAQNTIVIEGLLPDRASLLTLRSALGTLTGVKKIAVPLANYEMETNIPFTLTITL